MNCFAWNVRGLGLSFKAKEVGKFLLTHKVSLVGIFETRVNKELIVHSQKLIAPSWKWVDNSLHWHKVRIKVEWDESRFCLSVVCDHRQFIHCKVQLIDRGKICWITFVYGLNIIADRRPLWQQLM